MILITEINDVSRDEEVTRKFAAVLVCGAECTGVRDLAFVFTLYWNVLTLPRLAKLPSFQVTHQHRHAISYPLHPSRESRSLSSIYLSVYLSPSLSLSVISRPVDDRIVRWRCPASMLPQTNVVLSSRDRPKNNLQPRSSTVVLHDANSIVRVIVSAIIRAEPSGKVMGHVVDGHFSLDRGRYIYYQDRCQETCRSMTFRLTELNRY